MGLPLTADTDVIDEHTYAVLQPCCLQLQLHAPLKHCSGIDMVAVPCACLHQPTMQQPELGPPELDLTNFIGRAAAAFLVIAVWHTISYIGFPEQLRMARE